MSVDFAQERITAEDSAIPFQIAAFVVLFIAQDVLPILYLDLVLVWKAQKYESATFV